MIEEKTAAIVEAARAYIERIEEMGGARIAIEQGYQQGEIADAAYEAQKAIEGEEKIVVGVNRFRLEDQPLPPILSIDPASEAAQIARLQAVRERRDPAKAATSLESLCEAAGEDRNLMPTILDCVTAEVSLGEISNALRSVWGEFDDTGVA